MPVLSFAILQHTEPEREKGKGSGQDISEKCFAPLKTVIITDSSPTLRVGIGVGICRGTCRACTQECNGGRAPRILY